MIENMADIKEVPPMPEQAEEIKDFWAMNIALQKKKNALRKLLNKKGVLKKGGKNEYDKYSYFSEAQYKQLFTELFSEVGLELKFNVDNYERFDGEGKQSQGRLVTLEIVLYDIDTGFSEVTTVIGEGLDKGDKAGYKAYTGAIKYYLANTFLVATGDDPEKDSPEAKETTTEKKTPTATPKQIEVLAKVYTGDNLTKLLKANKIDKLEDISRTTASNLISKLEAKADEKAKEETEVE